MRMKGNTPKQLNGKNFQKLIKQFAISTPKVSQLHTQMDMSQYNFHNQNVVGKSVDYTDFLKSQLESFGKNTYAVPQIPMINNGRSFSTFNGVHSHSNMIERTRTDEYIKGMNPIAYQYIVNKYKKGESGFLPVSSIGITARGIRGMENASLLRLPGKNEKAINKRLNGLQGLKTRSGRGPFDSDRKDILVSTTLATSSQIYEYLKQNGQGNAEDYTVKAPKINIVKLRQSGAIPPIPGNYMMGRNSSNKKVKVFPSKHHDAVSVIGVNQGSKKIKKLKSIAQNMYASKKSNINMSGKASAVFDSFKSAIDQHGTPDYDDAVRAMLITGRVQQPWIFTGKKSELRQPHGVYASLAPVYPTTVPYKSVFNNQPSYVPIMAPDAHHGAHIFGNPSKHTLGVDHHVNLQNFKIANAKKSSIAHKYLKKN